MRFWVCFLELLVESVCLILEVCSSFLVGLILFVLCALDWAILTLICRNLRIHPVAINLYITFFSVLLFSPVFIFQPAMFDVFDFGLRFWGMMFIVAVLSTAVGTSIYYLGVARVGATQASSFNLLVPVMALWSSFIILDEIPSFLTLIGGSIAVFATYLINLYQPQHLKNLSSLWRNSP